MNVLFLTLINVENINYRDIYTDLIRELANRGVNVYVASARQKRQNLPTELVHINNINILKIRTGNITKTNFIEKGLSTVRIEGQYLRAIKKYFPNIRFDMVISPTPPITFEKVMKYFKESHNSKIYLMLKDIFPQNAVDINIIKKGSFVWRYFRKKEQKLYEISDVIGCMSKANIDYIAENNNISKDKLEVFPNSIKPIDRKMSRSDHTSIYEKYNLSRNSTLFVYGGNLGKPQGIDFLLEVISRFHRVENSYLFIVGSGTEFNRINSYMDTHKPINVRLLKGLPKGEYDELLDMMDVGLIFLDSRFTIPNFPSRITAYMENSIPVLAATDTSTDLKDTLVESKSGLWCESGKIDDFISNANFLALNKSKRIEMGLNGRKYLEENYDLTKTIDIILKHL